VCCVWDRWCGIEGVSICFVWESLTWVCGRVYVLCVGQFVWVWGVIVCCVWDSLVWVWGSECVLCGRVCVGLGSECVLCVEMFGVGLGE